MSWTQGLQEAETMPQWAREFFQSRAPEGAEFKYLVWDTTVPEIVHADYHDHEGNIVSKTFRWKRQ